MPFPQFQKEHVTTENFGAVTEIDETIDLPQSHPIEFLILRHEYEDSAAAVNPDPTRIDVDIAGQSLLGGQPFGVMRDLQTWWLGHDPGAIPEAAAGASAAWDLVVPFSRFHRDPRFALPAHAHNGRLELRINLDTAPDTLNQIQVHAVESFSRRAEGEAPWTVRKVSVPDTADLADGEDWRLEGNPGRRLGGLYLDHASTPALTEGGRIRAHVNNRQAEAYNIRRQELVQDMNAQNPFLDDAAPPGRGLLALPIDHQGDVRQAIATGAQQDVRDFAVEGQAAAAGTLRLLQEDYVALRNA